MSHIQLFGIAFVAMVFASTAPQATTRLVKPDGTGIAATIQAGVDASAPGDTVLLAPGTFTGPGNRDVRYNGKAITITSQNGAAATIIDCQGLGRGFMFVNNETAGSRLSHVTIKNGNAGQGGAIYAQIAKPTITDNIITNNTAFYDGGGIFVFGAIAGASQIARNTITGNTVTGGGTLRGGGIWTNSITHIIADNFISGNSADQGGGVWLGGGGDNQFNNNVVTGNSAGTEGGGVYVNGQSPTVSGNTITDNSAGSRGGGIFVTSSEALFDDCLIANNSAGLLGAGVYARTGAPTFRNITLAGNTGTGAIIVFSSDLSIERSIIAFNSGAAMLCFSGSAATVSCSDFYGNMNDAICGVDAGQNFSIDPWFCNAAVGDYRISSDSPATAANSPCGLLVGALPPCDPTGVGDDAPGARVSLFQNFPNPFNPATTIRYRLGDPGGHVTLAIHDVTGRLVRMLVDEQQGPGARAVRWDGRDDRGSAVASGVYFYRVTAPGVSEARRMVLLK
ncbi:MAG: right-handed parallel beta-helix repeat-containing protein [Candidatus Krumholzibacteria bacterium]|nr:right-handed parallel beta-helix repeat-containing protein [Candidatus Krumholzibacteria bacterium]MDH4338511.1 right-handed parallel beta-helix repeat-containing protein [Candidatus Krumholzibacteria bacterium]MDH5269238.1 right-handed parallel beta-helix repeat-containing protein [Candidatus Krumholzibacteria bacterium]MDH5628174.1 right-handed parallel beta-helix repeat-containing protein [Candidatus Krumholzibacteria bacterium]